MEKYSIKLRAFSPLLGTRTERERWRDLSWITSHGGCVFKSKWIGDKKKGREGVEFETRERESSPFWAQRDSSARQSGNGWKLWWSKVVNPVKPPPDRSSLALPLSPSLSLFVDIPWDRVTGVENRRLRCWVYPCSTNGTRRLYFSFYSRPRLPCSIRLIEYLRGWYVCVCVCISIREFRNSFI